MNRRSFLCAALAGVFCATATAAVAEPAAFTTQAFAAAQAAGKPILLHVTADWCGTCRVQKSIVAKLARRPEFSDYMIFNIDFDRQRDVLNQFGARHQSTMIVYRGESEIGRSVGSTSEASIDTLLRKAL